MLRFLLGALVLISFVQALEEIPNGPKVGQDAENLGTLVFVQALWRHGDRSPIYRIPNDPLGPANWTRGGSGGWGQLTTTGMGQHFVLGSKLRHRYQNLVNTEYHSNEIYVRSTDVNRTLISAISNMIGFYHGSGKPNIDYPTSVDWPTGYVPVPIHTVPEEWDAVLGVYNCDFEKKAYEKLEKTDEYKAIMDKNKDLIDQVIKITGIKNFKLDDIMGVRDTYFIERMWYKDSMQKEVTDELFAKIDVLAGVVDDLYFGKKVAKSSGVDFSVEMPRLNGGPLLWEIIDHMNHKRFCLDKAEKDRSEDDKKHCSYFDNLKYYVFSAHDTTVSSLFSTFGFTETNFNRTGLPHYASCATIELYLAPDGKTYNVKVIYWPEPGSKPDLDLPYEDVTTSITGCKSGCTLEQFSERSKPYKIEDMKKYCASGSVTTTLQVATLLLSLFAFCFSW